MAQEVGIAKQMLLHIDKLLHQLVCMKPCAINGSKNALKCNLPNQSTALDQEDEMSGDPKHTEFCWQSWIEHLGLFGGDLRRNSGGLALTSYFAFLNFKKPCTNIQNL